MSSPSNIINGTIADLPNGEGMPLALIGLGSNLQFGQDNPASIVRRALAALTVLSPFPVIASSLWRTTPVDCPPGSPDFVNAVAALLPDLAEADPTAQTEELLGRLQGIEHEFGRTRGSIRNAPRVLDLDLLACGDLQMATPFLTLPHPRLYQRAFVLAPLAEIAPGYRVAGQHQSVEELLKALQSGRFPAHDIERINIVATSVTL